MSHRPRILIADDESIIRRKTCMILGEAFDVQEAATAGEARLRIAEGYDATLLDIVFPDGNGIDICREHKQANPFRTVVMTSSLESVDAWNEAFAAGADYYLEKRELLALHPRKVALLLCNLIERNRLRREAEEAAERHAGLLSVLSHDVRAPFQALLGTVEMLRKSQIPPDAAQQVETLLQCTKDQLAFINSLLDYLRLESGMVGLRCLPLDVNLPVNQSVQQLEILASRKDIQILKELSTDTPKINGDIARISQVMNNLLTNAIKFTPRGGSITVRTRSSARGGAAGAEVIVEDTGAGIDEDDLEGIFQRFRRGRSQGTEGERGTGLGLSICKEVVERHGGAIALSRKEPNGTAATAWFPPAIRGSDEDKSSGCGKTPGSHDCHTIRPEKGPAYPAACAGT